MLPADDLELESNASSSDIGKFDKPLPPCPEPSINHQHQDDDLDDDEAASHSVISAAPEASLLPHFIQQRGDDLLIGSLLDSDVPLRYCCRFLVSSFLLTGTPGQLMPDRLVRVSVKSLAVGCLGGILRLYPRMLLASLAKVPVKDEQQQQQFVSDVLLLEGHADPQIRGGLAMAVGQFVQGALEHEEEEDCLGTESEEGLVGMENLVGVILKVLGCCSRLLEVKWGVLEMGK